MPGLDADLAPGQLHALGAEETDAMNVVRLRPMDESDTDGVHEWASQERPCRYQTWGPNSYDQTAVFVTDAARSWSDPGTGRVWAATTVPDGVIGMGDMRRHSESCCEFAEGPVSS